ncbi:MAG: CPBP family intramembrane glutamic endopeptidase [Phycisphaerae bacterium]|nr:CPBP family intramembrane glutamic endopeptidase [Phycisphaerae bacterium]
MPPSETFTWSDLEPHLWLLVAVGVCLPFTFVGLWRAVRWWLSGRPLPLPLDGAFPAVRWPAWYGLALFGAMLCLMFLVQMLYMAAEKWLLPWKPFGGADVASPGVFLAQILPPLFGLWVVSRFGRGAAATVGIRSGRVGFGLIHGLVALAVILPICMVALLAGALALRLVGVPIEPHPILERLQASGSPALLVATLVQASVLAPLAEEFIYRGVLMMSLLRRIGPAWAIAASSAIFAVLHFPVEPHSVLALFLLGAALGYVTYRTRSLMPAVIAHSAFNTLMVLGTFFAEA